MLESNFRGMKVTAKDQRNRDKQFKYIGDLRESFAKRCLLIISVDSKKKEKIGNFKNQGATWRRKAKMVNDHDFPSYFVGKGIPFGIYDTIVNLGSVYLGTTRDTPAFAVDSIDIWWKEEGIKRYPDAKELYILADSGCSNSARSRVWKYRLQTKMCDQFGLSITVSHYPPGASKWNPIEHRLFSEISKNWSDEPLETYEKALKLIRTTKTGLKVKAHFVRKHHKTGEKVPDSEMDSLSIKPHTKFPTWNYTPNPTTRM